jgi:CO dehydrogenase/acetyl-CoA synthase epsilon subunit
VVGMESLLDTEENVDCVKKFILENRIITVCATANNMEISVG